MLSSAGAEYCAIKVGIQQVETAADTVLGISGCACTIVKDPGAGVRFKICAERADLGLSQRTFPTNAQKFPLSEGKGFLEGMMEKRVPRPLSSAHEHTLTRQNLFPSLLLWKTVSFDGENHDCCVRLPVSVDVLFCV